jgi:hypothetical protein
MTRLRTPGDPLIQAAATSTSAKTISPGHGDGSIRMNQFKSIPIALLVGAAFQLGLLAMTCAWRQARMRGGSHASSGLPATAVPIASSKLAACKA